MCQENACSEIWCVLGMVKCLDCIGVAFLQSGVINRVMLCVELVFVLDKDLFNHFLSDKENNRASCASSDAGESFTKGSTVERNNQCL